MTTKAKKRKSMVGEADSADHAKLRQLLADHEPQTYGQLRRQFGISPVFLETQLSKYPTVFASSTELATGRPQIRLRDGVLESREDILKRATLIRAVRLAAPNPIRLARLYTGTRIASLDVQRLLKDVSGITVTSKGRDILYHWSGSEIEASGEPKKSRIQESEQLPQQAAEPIGEPDAELEVTRRMLVALLAKSHRHLSWLANYLDTALVHQVLLKWPDEFEIQAVDLGNPDLIIRNKCAVNGAPQTEVAQVANQPAEPLSELVPQEQLAQMRFKPASPDMARSRNDPRFTKGGIQRRRQPLITLPE